MATKPVITDLATNSRFTVAQINARFKTLADAFENVLGRDGVDESPNTVTQDIDMNGNTLLNLPTPVNPNDPVRLQDLPAITAIPAQVAADAAAAAASALAAQTAETNAETAETNAETAQAAAEAAQAAAIAAVGAVKVSSDDTTPSDLETKLFAGTNISMSTANPGANEIRTISGSTSPTITSFANANHTHADSAGGGVLTAVQDSIIIKNFFQDTAPSTEDIYGITNNGSVWVAVGQKDGVDAGIFTSVDGVSWIERAPTVPKNLTLNAVSWDVGTNIFVAVGEGDGIDGYILTSSNGATWTERTNPQNSELKSIDSSSGLSVAVGLGSYCVTSSDGATWTQRTIPTGSYFNVHYNSTQGLYVAVGNNGVTATSSNGTTWTSRTSGTTSALRGLACDGTTWVVVGDVDGGTGWIATSPDGITWTRRTTTFSADINGVIWTGYHFVATSDATASGWILYSTDGITWTADRLPETKNSYGISWNGSHLVVVGANGYIARSLKR